MEGLLTPKQKPQPISQIESHPGDKRVAQQDDQESSQDEEERPRRVEAATQSVTPSTWRKRAKWAKRLIQEAQECVKTPSSMFRQSKQPQRYTEYMALMTELLDTKPYCYEEATS